MIARVVAFGLACAAGVAYAQTPPLRPVEYRAQFAPRPGASADSGSRDGWESFPLSQETGYDPTITPETREGKSYLVREAAPTRDGAFQLGFVRRLDYVTGSASSLTIRVRVPQGSGPTRVTVSLFRGEKEERHSARVYGRSWQPIHFALAGSVTPLSALGLAADFPTAHAGRTERFELADVRLRGLAIPRLDLPAGAALWDPTRRLYYLRRALQGGERLPVSLGEASAWTLRDPGGHVRASARGPIAYRFDQGAAVGVWTLHLASAAAESTALLLVRPREPRALLFDQVPAVSSALLASIRERRDVLRKTAFSPGGNNIAAMGTRFLLPGLPSYFNVLLQPTELAMLDAIDFRASGDAAALAEARALLAGIAQWPLWVHPWFPAHGYHSYYPVGIAAKYVVVAREFLGAELSPEMRRALDGSLRAHVVEPIYEEYVAEDRLQFNTSNWIGNTVGGALLAALASNAPDAAGYALGLYVKQRDHVLAVYTADGSYGEGVTYQRFDLEMTTLVAEAAKRLLGQSMDAPLMGGERYMRHAAYGKAGLLDFGDSHVDLTPSNVFAYQAAQNQSDDLARFYFAYRDTGTAELLSRVLWEPGIHPPAAAGVFGEAASRVFPERGVVVLRDDWTAGSTVVAMRAGKNFNHNHADQGSLFFAWEGRLWLGEAGYADYYKDPFYPAYNIQAAGHNTLLLDHDPESQRLPGNAVFGRSPALEHGFVGDDASLIEADLSSVYPVVSQTCTRTLFHLPGGMLFVIDRIQAGAPRVVTQLWHPVQRVASLDRSRNLFVLTDGDKQVQVRAFSAVPLLTAQQDSPLPLTAYEQAERAVVERPVQVDFSTAAAQRATTLVTLIAPHADLAAARAVQRRGALEVNAGSSGVRVSQGADASISAWWSGGAMLLHGRTLENAGGARIMSNEAVDLKLTQRSGDTFALEVLAAAPTSLGLSHYVAMAEPGQQQLLDGGAQRLHAATGRSVFLLRAVP